MVDGSWLIAHGSLFLVHDACLSFMAQNGLAIGSVPATASRHFFPNHIKAASGAIPGLHAVPFLGHV